MPRRRRAIITLNEQGRPTFKRLDSPEIPVINLRKNYSEAELAELNKLRRKLAKRANNRLLSLERAGIEYGAYAQAAHYLSQVVAPGRKLRFSEAAALPLKDLRQQLYEIERFLNAQTSTLGGVHKFQSHVYQTAAAKYGFDTGTVTEADYLSFVSSQAFQVAKKQGYISSEELVEFFNYASSQGKTKAEINQALNDLNRGKIEDIQALYNAVDLDFFDYFATRNS